MIREFTTNDLDSVMEIWLEGNLNAHSFIPADYFKNSFNLVKGILPHSTIYVQDVDGVQGFIGLTDNYISGLFVKASAQHKGFGGALIEKAKQLHPELFVHVYVKNQNAVQFYLSQGFEIVEESSNEETQMPEYLLRCEVNHTVKIGKCAL